MRYTTMLCLIVFATAAQAEPFSKDMCRQYAEGVEYAAETYRKSNKLEGDGKLLDFTDQTSGAMLSASKKAVEAGERNRAAQRAYITSLEDLSYQFRLCAR